MIQNFNFVKKNENEIFREKCGQVSQLVDKLLDKLTQIRRIVYQCDSQTEKPLIDSCFKDDIVFIKRMVKKCSTVEQKHIFSQTITTLAIYKCEFEQICKFINEKLKQQTQGLRRSHMTSVKIFEILNQRKEVIQNYFYSLEDSDSPCKVRSEVFTF